MLSSAACRTSIAPASVGVTLGQRTSAWARATGSITTAIAPLSISGRTGKLLFHMGVAMPKSDLGAIAAVSRTGYPAPYASAVAGRYSQRLTRAAGLTDFGVNIITLEPGAWSSQRHWHETEDEFVIMLERSEEHTSELQSLLRISYAVFCLKKKKNATLFIITHNTHT